MSGKPIKVKDGRFGPYVTDGTTNATIPRAESVEEITFERAVELLADQARQGPGGPDARSAPPTRKHAGEEGARQEAGGQEEHGVSRGVFITLEGGDGSGQDDAGGAARASGSRAQGRTVVRTREPGGTEVGVEVREIVLHHRGDIAPRAEALLYAADRAHHVATVVRPALERGDVVIQDRYIDSSVAYQGAGRVLDPEAVRGPLGVGDRGPAARPHHPARPRRGRPRAAASTRRAPATTGSRPRHPSSTTACAPRTSRSPTPSPSASSSSTRRAPVDEIAGVIRARVAGLL